MEQSVVPPGGDRNAGPELEALDSLSMSIAFVLVTLRFYVRACMVKKLWWDDLFLLLGMLLSIAGFGIFVARVNSGFGRHVYYLSPKQITFALKLENIGVPIAILSTTLTKISICLLLLRIFTSNRLWRRAMYIITALIVATNVSSAILALHQMKNSWNPTIEGTWWMRETRTAEIYYYHSGVSIFTDFLLAFLPGYFLKDLQIPLRTKISIFALMSLGIFTGICAINKTAFFSTLNTSDITYSAKKLSLWTTLEKNVAIIAAAMPALRPLWATKNANQNRKTSGQHHRLDDKQRPNSPYVSVNEQVKIDSLSSCLESRITVQGGRSREDIIGGEASSLADCSGSMKTSDIGMENLPKFEGKWFPEHSGLSDKERNVEDMV